MSKNKKENKRLERKIISLFSTKPTKIFNYKQIASLLDINDTKGRNNIIRLLNQLHSQKQLKQINRGKYQYRETEKNITKQL